MSDVLALKKTPLAIAKAMTPEDRARMVATAEGWGKIRAKRWEAENRAWRSWAAALGFPVRGGTSYANAIASLTSLPPEEDAP